MPKKKEFTDKLRDMAKTAFGGVGEYIRRVQTEHDEEKKRLAHKRQRGESGPVPVPVPVAANTTGTGVGGNAAVAPQPDIATSQNTKLDAAEEFMQRARGKIQNSDK